MPSPTVFLLQAKKDGLADSTIAKYDGEWTLEAAKKDPLSGDMGLVLKTKAKHAAIAAKLRKPFSFGSNPLVVQYELNFQNGQDCGGGYIKLLSQSKDLDLRQFTDKVWKQLNHLAVKLHVMQLKQLLILDALHHHVWPRQVRFGREATFHLQVGFHFGNVGRNCMISKSIIL